MPEPARGQVRIRTAYCGVCATDLALRKTEAGQRYVAWRRGALSLDARKRKTLVPPEAPPEAATPPEPPTASAPE